MHIYAIGNGRKRQPVMKRMVKKVAKEYPILLKTTKKATTHLAKQTNICNFVQTR